MIDRGKLPAIRFRLLLVPHLCACGGYVMPVLSGQLCGCGSGRCPARTSVVADAADRYIIDHPLVVNIVDVGDVHIIDRAIVVEIASPPAATEVSVPRIAISVVDAAIEAHLQPPITCTPSIESA